MTPGRCKGKAHQPEHLGIAGRRVLVSRKWSNKTLDDHRAERGEFVRQLLHAAGIQPTHGPQDGPYQWERTAPTDPDIPPRPCCSSAPSPSDSDGKPNTPLPYSPLADHRPTTVRQARRLRDDERGPAL
jgi:replication initiator protein RepSA